MVELEGDIAIWYQNKNIPLISPPVVILHRNKNIQTIRPSRNEHPFNFFSSPLRAKLPILEESAPVPYTRSWPNRSDSGIGSGQAPHNEIKCRAYKRWDRSFR